jgi:diguanylate cyclase (GGDEF)-like protein
LEQLLTASVGAGDALPLGVVACDLDRFRRVNEGLGRAAGDELLRLAAERLSGAAGDHASVARIGSDEFVVVLPGVGSAADLEAHVAALDAAVRRPVRLGGRPFHPSASFGSAFLPPAPRDDVPGSALALLHAAEADLEVAKARRRNRPPEGAASDLLQLEADLHIALERRELVAHFQPVYDLRTGRLVGFETLARWPHPESGFIPPDVFIALAEDNGMIDAIGIQMLQAAGRFLSEHRDPSIVVSVNVSTKQASRRGFAGEVADLFAGAPEILGRLVLELTETAIVLDHRLVEQELRELSRLGVVVALDDFGSGYSSLKQLQDLPVTVVKIDREFVQREGAVGQGILEAMLRLAATLGLSAVAEGVERPEQLRMLQGLGCHQAQGYLFSPPLPADLAHALPATMQGLTGL